MFLSKIIVIIYKIQDKIVDRKLKLMQLDYELCKKYDDPNYCK